MAPAIRASIIGGVPCAVGARRGAEENKWGLTRAKFSARAFERALTPRGLDHGSMSIGKVKKNRRGNQ